MTSALPTPAAGGPVPPGSGPVETRVGEAFVRAVVSRDFDAIQALFAPDVRFRALTPRAERLAPTAAEARGWLEAWFGETDQNQLIQSCVEMVADRLHVAYRMRLREDGAWYLVEQQLFGSLGNARLTDVALVCSGFRPVAVDAATGIEPSAHEQRVDARLEAIGKSCATLTPDIRAALRLLEPGQVLEIVADDPTAEGDLGAWARLTGNDLIGVATPLDAPRHFYVRRGTPKRGAEA